MLNLTLPKRIFPKDDWLVTQIKNIVTIMFMCSAASVSIAM